MDDRVDLAYAPAVAGLVFRRYRGKADHGGMAGAVNSENRAAHIEEVHSAERFDKSYAHLDNCDPETDILMAEIDGRLIGYARTTWREEPDGGFIHFTVGAVHADAQGQGIGAALNRFTEERVRAIASNRKGRTSLDGWAWDTQKAARRIYEKAGYEEVSYDALMIRPDLEDIPDVPLPDGFVVRTPAEDEMRKVWDADTEAFRDHWGFTEPVDEDYRQFLEFEWREPALWCVAWDGDEVASQVRSFVDGSENEEYSRHRGYTEFISTRRPYRRKGLARALLARSLCVLKERGMAEAALGVHVDNPNGAFGLYESVGFRVAKTMTSFRKHIKD